MYGEMTLVLSFTLGNTYKHKILHKNKWITSSQGRRVTHRLDVLTLDGSRRSEVVKVKRVTNNRTQETLTLTNLSNFNRSGTVEYFRNFSTPNYVDSSDDYGLVKSPILGGLATCKSQGSEMELVVKWWETSRNRTYHRNKPRERKGSDFGYRPTCLKPDWLPLPPTILYSRLPFCLTTSPSSLIPPSFSPSFSYFLFPSPYILPFSKHL